jgi:hypothetical protein
MTGTSGKGWAGGVDGMGGVVGRLRPVGRRGRDNRGKLLEEVGYIRSNLRG